VNHLVLELLKSRTGTFITHVPYRGVAPATLDMLSDQVQLVTGTIPAVLPFIKDGRVKPLAVTSAKRSSALPDVLARFKSDAVEPAPGSPALLGAFIEADYRAWRNVVMSQKLVIE